ncbi:MAG: S41 family peptidase [Thermoflexales bacterium]|nr:S41 family peptidase [Thermoflexales bacterium]MCS7323951.1 S41 family peptidase [Thermoflexales bacterium]MCX7939254.1 S41 family peptidase [Thermoflexales bacterium]MDW8053194.1 S41 family peptidase [Anaerolineae bacterium]MDW8291845.1 S41 family peptidase [Anaerolineae bacterium]
MATPTTSEEKAQQRSAALLRQVALGLLGMFTGAIIFVLGMTVGVLLARPGAFSFGAFPFELATLTTVSSHSAPEARAEEPLDYALVNDVLRRLREQWYGTLPSREALTDGAIRGMVNALGDPYTQYIEPRFAKILNEDMSGEFEGIGATLKQTPGGSIQIVRTLPGTPAEKAGLLPGDIIEAVDGQSVLGLNTTEVAAMVRGPKGTTVRLTIRRGDNPRPFEVSIVRARIVIPLVESRTVGDGDIAYVRLFDFSQQASRQLERELQRLLAQNPKGLILDLRDNPGGLLSQAREVGDLFLDAGVLVVERDYRNNRKVTRTTSRGIAQDIPLVVLVNGGSASAAEIVAGAIQDRKRGVLIGERTFGKGSVQSPQTLANGAQLRITIERWYTPNERQIHNEGIQPDLVVINTPEDERAGKDAQLEAAVAYLKTGKLAAP